MKYMTDEELLKLISDVENEDLVQAPPGIEDAVLARVDSKKKVIEYRRFRNRVMVAVASILLITAIIPESMKLMPESWYANDEYLETGNYDEVGVVKPLSDLISGHDISDLLNGREE